MSALPPAPVLRARNLHRRFPIRRGPLLRRRMLQAVDDVSLDLAAGETLAIVGESGCGKSTLGRMLALADMPTSGTIEIAGTPVTSSGQVFSERLYRHVQLIFQNPIGSLNPRKTVAAIVEEPLRGDASVAAADRRAAVAAMLGKVGLAEELAGRFPHMLSGGQRQRVAIARALMLRPAIVVADEPLSALDVSVQAQIINLLMDLRDEFGTATVFISHDISVVRRMAHSVMVMYLGRPVEYGPAAEVLSKPQHPYTRALLASVPNRRLGQARARAPIAGEAPSPIDLPDGCAFRSRCPVARPSCATDRPLLAMQDGRLVACPFAADAD